MKRVLFLPTLGFAHVTRLLVLAKEMAGEFKVRIAISRQFASLAEELQIDLRIVDLPPVDYDRFARGELIFDTEQKIEKPAVVYGEVMDEFQPDCVVSSMPIAMRIPIRARRTPHVTLFDACNHMQFREPNEPTEEQEQALAERSRQILERYNAVAVRMNAPEEKSMRLLFIADLNLLPDIPFLFPIRDLPRTFAYMGPVSWKGSDRPLDPTVVVDKNKPLIYVTMGSSGNREHLRVIAEQLRKSQYQVVMTTGGVVDAQELKSYERAGFYVRDFLPGDKVIGSSSQTIVICHGGIGTVYQALENRAHGIIVIPAHRQHRRIGRRLVETGLGRTLAEDELGGIVELADELLRSSQAEALVDVEKDLGTYAGAPLGKKLIVEFMAGR